MCIYVYMYIFTHTHISICMYLQTLVTFKLKKDLICLRLKTKQASSI